MDIDFIPRDSYVLLTKLCISSPYLWKFSICIETGTFKLIKLRSIVLITSVVSVIIILVVEFRISSTSWIIAAIIIPFIIIILVSIECIIIVTADILFLINVLIQLIIASADITAIPTFVMISTVHLIWVVLISLPWILLHRRLRCVLPWWIVVTYCILIARRIGFKFVSIICTWVPHICMV